MMKEVVMWAWLDLHVHLRNFDQGGLGARVLKYTVAFCEWALGMPNTVPCLATGKDAMAYDEAVTAEREAQGLDQLPFNLITTIKLLSRVPGVKFWTTVETIVEAWQCGVRAAKLYPLAKQGIGTTGAELEGVDLDNLEEMYPIFRMMARLGMILCVHAQVPWSFTWRQELDFLPIIDKLAKDIPNLIIVFEHVSTAEGVAWVKRSRPGVYATITGHHFCFTADDVLGRLYNHCMPPILRPEDRAAIWEVVFNRNPKFFFGSDSAPHLWVNKTALKLCENDVVRSPAGVYSSPVVASYLFGVFVRELGSVDAAVQVLEPFTSKFGATAYGLPPNQTKVRFVYDRWRVPELYDGIVPMGAGTWLDWRLESRFREAA